MISSSSAWWKFSDDTSLIDMSHSDVNTLLQYSTLYSDVKKISWFKCANNKRDVCRLRKQTGAIQLAIAGVAIECVDNCQNLSTVLDHTLNDSMDQKRLFLLLRPRNMDMKHEQWHVAVILPVLCWVSADVFFHFVVWWAKCEEQKQTQQSGKCELLRLCGVDSAGGVSCMQGECKES